MREVTGEGAWTVHAVMGWRWRGEHGNECRPSILIDVDVKGEVSVVRAALYGMGLRHGVAR